VNYAAGTATNTITIKNMYIYGGSVWATIYFLAGLAEAGTASQAIAVMMDVYIMKLFGWPWDELLLADALPGLIRSHVQTWAVGWLFATLKYGLNS
jgi:hypothetical protein